MTTHTLTPELHRNRAVVVEGAELSLSSYKLGDRYAARVENSTSGEVLARGRGATRDEAEGSALDSAAMRLNMSSARAALARSVTQLGPKK